MKDGIVVTWTCFILLFCKTAKVIRTFLSFMEMPTKVIKQNQAIAVVVYRITSLVLGQLQYYWVLSVGIFGRK